MLALQATCRLVCHARAWHHWRISRRFLCAPPSPSRKGTTPCLAADQRSCLHPLAICQRPFHVFYCCRINGLTHLNLTKLDVLSELEEIKASNE